MSRTRRPALPDQTPPPSRREAIRAIEKLRGSRVISYVTSTRQNFDAPMAIDVVRRIFDLLELIKANAGRRKKPRIDLFVHSNGGDNAVPWRLVTLIREYCDDFSVLIPNRAFSAATFLALGADQIVMHPMGMLGPTDPTVSNGFNPIDPRNNQRIGISVEDVTAYFHLIKEDLEIQKEDELVKAFNKLVENVHPLALGNVKRSLSQSKLMADKLLRLHMKDSQGNRIQSIVDHLTSKLFYHGHPINRKEAKEQFGLKCVNDAHPRLERAMWELFLAYEADMRLAEPFDPTLEFMRQHDVLAMKAGESALTAPAVQPLVYVESTDAGQVYASEYRLHGTKQPNHGLSMAMVQTRRGWTPTEA